MGMTFLVIHPPGLVYTSTATSVPLGGPRGGGVAG